MTSLLTTVGTTLSQEIQSLTRRRPLPSPPESVRRSGGGGGTGDDQNQTRQQQQQQRQVAEPLKPGDHAPQSDAIHFPSRKALIIVFLRHCGCPCKPGSPKPPLSARYLHIYYISPSLSLSCQHHSLSDSSENFLPGVTKTSKVLLTRLFTSPPGGEKKSPRKVFAS